MVLGTLQTRDQFNNDLNNRYKQVVRQRLEDICLEQGTVLMKYNKQNICSLIILKINLK